MGTSTHCGHYVAHILKEGRWVIFNDSKVGISTDPPKDMGYLYFFQRLENWLGKPSECWNFMDGKEKKRKEETETSPFFL